MALPSICIYPSFQVSTFFKLFNLFSWRPILHCVFFMSHRYGVVLRKLDLLKEAVDVLVEALHALPLHWGAWLELSNLVTNIDMVVAFYFIPFDTLKITIKYLSQLRCIDFLL